MNDRAVEMVRAQIAARDVSSPAVLRALERVPRGAFVPEDMRAWAYADMPLPIGEGQTISQPYVVAKMTELAQAAGKRSALDVGTGSGYQAAVLAELCEQVTSIELSQTLAASARRRLGALGYAKVDVRCGDGANGAADRAPFDVIIVGAAPLAIPQALIAQLGSPGRLVLPIGGEGDQELVVVSKDAAGETSVESVALVRFVPLR